MKIRKTVNGSNGAIFILAYKPFKVIIEDGITTVYLTKEDAILLKNDIKFKFYVPNVVSLLSGRTKTRRD